jgi:subtilisin-like proprotein convertase family protein
MNARSGIAVGLVGLLACFLWSGVAVAAVPGTAVIEGTLQATGGGPAADGDYAVVFALYKDQAGGSAFWSEGPVTVKVASGLFTYAMGTTTPLKAADLTTSAWLGVKIDQDPELPRKPVHSSVFALRAAVAESLACSGCVGATQLDAAALKDYLKAGDLATVALSGAYADLTGAPDLSAFIKAANLADVATTGAYADLSGAPDLTAYAKTAGLAKVATTGKYIDLGEIPTAAQLGKSCGSNLVVVGLKADGALECAVPAAAATIPPDGIDEISNSLIWNQFTDAFASTVAMAIPDNNPIGAYTEIDVGDVGLAQKLTVSLELANSDISGVQVWLYDSANQEYVLYNKGGKKGEGIKTSYPDPTKTVSGDLTYWVGKNPKGKWRLKVVDTAFLNNTTDGQVVKWSVNLQTLSSKKIRVAGDLIVDGTTTLIGDVTIGGKLTIAGQSDVPAGTCPAAVINGACMVGSGSERTFINAAKYCAARKADLCTDSQTWVLRGARTLNANASWTNSFSDNDGGQWNEVNGGTGDDHVNTSGWLAPCCYNLTPVRPTDQDVGGVRVLFINNAEDTKFREAATHCVGMQADLCSKAQYWVMRQKGAISVRMWSSDHSDNDNEGYEKGIGQTSDDTNLGQNYGYACCASKRTTISCPAPYTDVQGVCVIKANNSGGNWNTAANDCATAGGRLCSVAQSSILRAAGTITHAANWTESYSDNDGNNASVGVGNAGDDHPNNSSYGWACCY